MVSNNSINPNPESTVVFNKRYSGIDDKKEKLITEAHAPFRGLASKKRFTIFKNN